MLSSKNKRDKVEVTTEKTLKNGLTIKVFVVFVIVLVVLNKINHEAVLHGTRTAIDSRNPLSALGMVVLFALMGLNWFGHKIKIHKYLSFSGPEMVTLYCMIALGALISCGGILYQITDALTVFTLPLLGDTVAIRSHMPNYREIIEVLENRVFMPTDVDLLRAYWLGFDRSRIDSVPWGLLWASLGLLFALYGTIMLVGLCIATLVRKHWTEHEHMSYPLTLPVQALVDPEMRTQDTQQGIWKSKLLWAGILTSALLTIYRIAHSYWPAIPTFNVFWNVGVFFRDHPILYGLEIYPSYIIWLNPLVFGLGYLIPADTAFTIVFVQFLHQVIKLITLSMGISETRGLYETWYMTITGGYIALGIAAIIPARAIIREIWKKAIYNTGMDDTNEGMSYRVALFGLIGGVLIITAFFTFLLGMNWVLSLFYAIVGVVFGCFSYARIRARTGMPTIVSRFGPAEVLVDGVGTSYGNGRISVYDSHIIYSFSRIPALSGMLSTTAFGLEAYQIGDKVNANRKNLTIAMILAMAIAFVVGMYFLMEFKFEVGSRGLPEWNILWFPALQAPYYPGIAQPAPLVGPTVLIAGLITAFLSYMKMTFVWWPLDPLGFVGGSILEFGGYFWFNIFLAWFIKVVIIRYGGRSGWVRIIRPYFIGIIIGYVIVTALGSILGLKSAGW